MTTVGREDLSALPVRYNHDHRRVHVTGEVSKRDALIITGASEINLRLVGSGRNDRCGVPLKTFDLLGAVRSVLYFSPRDSDAALFLERFAPDLYYPIDSEQLEGADLRSLQAWLLRVRRAPSAPKRESSSDLQSALIAQLLGVLP